MSELKRVFDKEALARNIAKIRTKTKARIAAVVKADAYGFGIARSVPVMLKNKISDFFVNDISEAIAVRKIAKKENIFVFSGLRKGEEKIFKKYNVIPVCISLEQVARAKDLPVAIHFDTGMNRTGLSLDDAKKIPKTAKVVLYISHLTGPFSKAKIRLRKFKEILAVLPKKPVSFCSSSGILRLPAEFHFDMVRTGSALFGLASGFDPTMSVYAEILQIKAVSKGGAIGYSSGFVASRDMKIAVLNVGYADGYDRAMSKTNSGGFIGWLRRRLNIGTGSSRAFVVINGKKCPVIGLVSMNNITVDVSDVAKIAAGEFAEIIGHNANILEFRNAFGYIPTELAPALGRGQSI